MSSKLTLLDICCNEFFRLVSFDCDARVLYFYRTNTGKQVVIITFVKLVKISGTLNYLVFPGTRCGGNTVPTLVAVDIMFVTDTIWWV